MAIVVVRFPHVASAPSGKSRQCPHCGSAILQNWGQTSRPVRDADMREITIYRFRCCNCGRTFRLYPDGADRSTISQRMLNLAALTFAIGLSVKEVGDLFDNLGVTLSRMTIYRAGHQMVDRLGYSGGRKYQEVYLMEKTHTQRDKLRGGVRLIMDVGRGKYVVLGILDEYNPHTVQNWLQPVCHDIGAEVYVLDTGKLQQHVGV